MTVGETIRYYRKKCKMTQAQLAKAVGVSVQAISKWETNAGFPDIAQVIPLARALDITTDTLLNFTDRRENFEKLWYETNDRTHGDPRRLREVSQAALELYPEDEIFLLRACVDEEQLAHMAENERDREQHLRSALLHCRRLLRVDPEDGDTQLRTVRILSQLGMDDEATAMAYHCEYRDEALKYCLKGDDLRCHRQKIIDRMFSTFLRELQEGDPAMLDAAEAMIHAAIPDGNYQHYYEFLAGIYLKRFEFYRVSGDEETACVWAREVLELAKKADSVQDRAFTAPLFDLLENINPENPPDRVWRWLLSYVENEIPQWRENAALAKIVNDAYAYLEKISLPSKQ